jgi:protein phosphatase
MTAKADRCEYRNEPSQSQSRVPAQSKVESPASSLVKVDLAARSHAGNVRSTNEDHYLVVRAERSLNVALSNLPAGELPSSFDEVAYGAIVADGIGGMPAGQLASKMALSKLVELVAKTPDWIMKMNRGKAGEVQRRMARRFRHIDTSLRKHGMKDPALAGMGTTMTLALTLGSDLFVGHIGDSRAYLLRGGVLHQLTRDHTLARAMIDAGIASEEDETVRGLRRVLTAALGSTAQPTNAEVQHLSLCNGDLLLLCTDGLTECVDVRNIRSILTSSESMDEVCGLLIEAALRSGGTDNVTAVLARYRFPKTV